MTKYKTEQKEIAEGMGAVGEVAKKLRGGTQSGENVIQGNETGGNPLWLIDLVTFGGDGEDGGGDTHRVSEADYREAGVVKGRWDVGESQCRSSAGSGGNKVGDDLNRKKTRDSGTVGGSAADYRGVRK